LVVHFVGVGRGDGSVVVGEILVFRNWEGLEGICAELVRAGEAMVLYFVGTEREYIDGRVEEVG
jgi:hypothetical protein